MILSSRVIGFGTLARGFLFLSESFETSNSLQEETSGPASEGKYFSSAFVLEMGNSSSRIEEDKALQLCRERKKFVKQALDGRCSMAAAHVTYIQSLKNTGIALRKLVESEAPIESSLYTSTSATPEPLASTEKSLSHLSYSSPSLSQHVDVAETLSSTHSPPYSGRIQANFMKSGGSFSTTVEERPFPVTGTLRSSTSTPQNLTPRSAERLGTSPFQDSPLPPGTPHWDYFGLFHPNDNQISFQDVGGLDHGLDNADDIRRLREEEGIPELEEEERKSIFTRGVESEESEDKFDKRSADDLVQSFENRNRVLDSYSTASPAIQSSRIIAPDTTLLNGQKNNSPDLVPLKATTSMVALPIDDKKIEEKEAGFENKLAPKDFLSSIKEIENLFCEASESGREVPRMLEANKLHFRPVFPGKEEPAPTTIKYLTWHRTASSPSSSSRNLLGETSKDDTEDISSNPFNNICMNSGSHASTLDRLYAWERKLYDEVKASGIIRSEYDRKCKLLREQESGGERSYKIDKTRAVVKDLHSRIRVAIHRIDSISKRIEEIRDKELQPQLEELIDGLSRMWEIMFKCHECQFNIISRAYNNGGTKIILQSELHRQATIHLEDELSSLSSSFTKWINAQKSYVRAIDGWLNKCISLQQKSSGRKRRKPEKSLRDQGPPPIFVTCGVWLDILEGKVWLDNVEGKVLPMKDVADSIKVLAAEATRFLPRQEKNQGKSLKQSFSSAWKADSGSEAMANILGNEAPQDWNSDFDHFRSSLVNVLYQLKRFGESSVWMYVELRKAIQEAKSNYEKNVLKSHS